VFPWSLFGRRKRVSTLHGQARFSENCHGVLDDPRNLPTTHYSWVFTCRHSYGLLEFRSMGTLKTRLFPPPPPMRHHRWKQRLSLLKSTIGVLWEGMFGPTTAGGSCNSTTAPDHALWVEFDLWKPPAAYSSEGTPTFHPHATGYQSPPRLQFRPVRLTLPDGYSVSGTSKLTV